jgi:hypothetical protein
MDFQVFAILDWLADDNEESETALRGVSDDRGLSRLKLAIMRPDAVPRFHRLQTSPQPRRHPA